MVLGKGKMRTVVLETFSLTRAQRWNRNFRRPVTSTTGLRHKRFLAEPLPPESSQSLEASALILDMPMLSPVQMYQMFYLIFTKKFKISIIFSFSLITYIDITILDEKS